MTREEAIRILKNFSLCGVYHQLIRMNDTDSEAISMAIKALEQPEIKCIAKVTLTDEQVKEAFEKAKCEILAVPSAQRWIPVSERLPDITDHHTSEPCIVYCDNGAYGFAELEENIFGQVGWNCERDDEYHEPLGEVFAWMPLPEPYKPECEEDEDETD